MNSEKTDFNKIELIRKLEILRELEMKKPINEIDTDFIDEINLNNFLQKDIDFSKLKKLKKAYAGYNVSRWEEN